MNRSLAVAILTASYSILGLAAGSAPADAVASSDQAGAGLRIDQVQSRGAMRIPASTQAVPLYVSFQGSRTLTRQLSERLEALGWQVTDDQAATHSLIAKGEVHVWGKGYGLEADRVSLTMPAIVDGNQVPARPKPGGLFGVFGSIRESFNTAVSGSPDGWCMSDLCRLVWQSAVVTMTYRSANKDQRLDVSVRAASDALALDVVVNEVVRKSFAEIGAGIDAAADPAASASSQSQPMSM